MSGADAATIEQWWPRLSIASKHAILDAMTEDRDTEIPDHVRAEIQSLTGGEIRPTRIDAAEREFIRTQREIVD